MILNTSVCVNDDVMASVCVEVDVKTSVCVDDDVKASDVWMMMLGFSVCG